MTLQILYGRLGKPHDVRIVQLQLRIEDLVEIRGVDLVPGRLINCPCLLALRLLLFRQPFQELVVLLCELQSLLLVHRIVERLLDRVGRRQRQQPLLLPRQEVRQLRPLAAEPQQRAVSGMLACRLPKPDEPGRFQLALLRRHGVGTRFRPHPKPAEGNGDQNRKGQKADNRRFSSAARRAALPIASHGRLSPLQTEPSLAVARFNLFVASLEKYRAAYARSVRKVHILLEITSPSCGSRPA